MKQSSSWNNMKNVKWLTVCRVKYKNDTIVEAREREVVRETSSFSRAFKCKWLTRCKWITLWHVWEEKWCLNVCMRGVKKIQVKVERWNISKKDRREKQQFKSDVSYLTENLQLVVIAQRQLMQHWMCLWEKNKYKKRARNKCICIQWI